MKAGKRMCMMMCLVIAAAVSGCGKKAVTSEKNGNRKSGVEEVLQQGMAAADQAPVGEEPPVTVTLPGKMTIDNANIN